MNELDTLDEYFDINQFVADLELLEAVTIGEEYDI